MNHRDPNYQKLGAKHKRNILRQMGPFADKAEPFLDAWNVIGKAYLVAQPENWDGRCRWCGWTCQEAKPDRALVMEPCVCVNPDCMAIGWIYDDLLDGAINAEDYPIRAGYTEAHMRQELGYPESLFY